MLKKGISGEASCCRVGGWGPRGCLNKRLACLAGLEESMGREEDKPGKVCENQVTGGRKRWVMRAFISRSHGATEACDTES